MWKVANGDQLDDLYQERKKKSNSYDFLRLADITVAFFSRLSNLH